MSIFTKQLLFRSLMQISRQGDSVRKLIQRRTLSTQRKSTTQIYLKNQLVEISSNITLHLPAIFNISNYTHKFKTTG